MISKKIIRIYVITSNQFLYRGISKLIEESRVFDKCICNIEQTSKLPSVIFYKKYFTFDIIITDNYLHCYAISKYRPEKTLILPGNYGVERYIECFSNLSDYSNYICDVDLNILSAKESLIFSLFSEGATDDNISVMLNITKKTISAHRRNILNKLNLKNRHELYIYALATKEGCYENV